MAKVLSGEASADELEAFDSWLEADPANKATFVNLKSAWMQADTLLEQPRFDTAAAWIKVNEQLLKGPEKPASRSIHLPVWSKVFLAAAAVLVIGFIGFWKLFQTGTVVVVASDQLNEIALPDGSVVILKPGSTLEYPRSFSGESRSVTMEGEGFFDVTRNPDLPFIIDAGAASVRVLGTSFNVESDQDSVVVTVSTGSVLVKSNQVEGLQITLKAGERASAGNKTLQKTSALNQNHLYWKTGQMEFQNTPLQTVVDELKRYADIDLRFSDAASRDFRGQLVTISFKGQTNEQILEALGRITNGTISQKDKQYILGPGR